MQETTLSKDDKTITRIEIVDEEYSDRYGFAPKTEEKKTFFKLCSAIRQCGEAARTNQSHIHRSFKDDGTILTETDLAISDALLACLRKLYPDCNIITEEIDLKTFSENARYTFVLDPIDGTDAYSQGLPAWAVALGILDNCRRPCGAVIYAPRFGVGTDDLFFCSLPGEKDVYLNGKLHEPPKHYVVPRQMVVASNILNHIDMSAYKDKIRAFGSSIVHTIAPVVFSNQDCSINTYCYAWDVAAAHAIVEKCTMKLTYIDGSKFEYDDRLLLERRQIRMPIIIGYEDCHKWMMNNLRMY